MEEYISRQAVIHVIEKYIFQLSEFQLSEYKNYFLMQLKNAIKADLVNDINNIPSVGVEPVKHGKWKKIDYADEVNGYLIPNYECSNCHNWARDMTDFCPNCGARMDAEEEYNE